VPVDIDVAEDPFANSTPASDTWLKASSDKMSVLTYLIDALSAMKVAIVNKIDTYHGEMMLTLLP
jgi:hypothetical protein